MDELLLITFSLQSCPTSQTPKPGVSHTRLTERDPRWRLPRDYDLFEQAFLQWAEHSEVSAALLDATIWGALASAGELACDILGVTKLGQQPMPVWPCG